MSVKVRLGIAAVVTALTFGIGACSQDEEQVEEVVQPEQPDEPGTPEDTSLQDTAISAETVYFAFDDYTLSPSARSKLDDLASRLNQNQSAVVQIEGHCDERGSIEYNLALGTRRAQSVMNYLTQMGVDASRLSTISYGEEKPAAEGHDESAWSQNRRAEFVISSQ